MPTNIMTGTIKTLVKDRGYGFIRPDGKGPDVFFHLSVLQDARFEELEVDKKVRYEQGEGRNGKPRAEKIWTEALAEPAPAASPEAAVVHASSL